MRRGFVLVSCDAGSEREILRKLSSFSEVTYVYQIIGMYDIIAEIKCDSPQKFREIISWKFHKIEKIRSIVSLMDKPALN
ncbi:MAG: hypothetical protein MAG458_01147 [Nitrosopumilus sp.]|nr:hypothetical protein [Nitrosopumilus sp.]